MAQYQTFPGATGDSRTLDKLKQLRLPRMQGKRFLDVGCNEGFFCGYAHFDGAARAVGLDVSATFVQRARARFPACEFLQQSWDHLPDGEFDVILLASAIHYADDQAALVHALMRRLAPDGVLVLELGIAPAAKSAWVKVKRGIDERYFPTMAMVREVLQDYSWKLIGPSVAQDGDSVDRHVIHVHRRRPMAYLLMQPPGYGKTSIAASLFDKAGVRVVSGDATLYYIARGELAAPAALAATVAADFSALAIDDAIARVADAGLLDELARIWVGDDRSGDIAIDAYVPAAHHRQVEQALAALGYMPVTLGWERVGPTPPSGQATQQLADCYYAALLEGRPSATARPLPFTGTTGFVDEVSIDAGQVTVRGWAVHESGAMPTVLAVKLAGRIEVVPSFDRQQRPDVQSHFGLGHDVCGFRFSVRLPDARGRGLQVFGGNAADRLDGPFHMSASASQCVSNIEQAR